MHKVKNLDILKQNMLDKLTDPLEQEKQCQIPVFNPHKMTRGIKKKHLETVTEIKCYQIVFNNRVVNTCNFRSYLYGYLEVDWNEQDKLNLQMLCYCCNALQLLLCDNKNHVKC